MIIWRKKNIHFLKRKKKRRKRKNQSHQKEKSRDSKLKRIRIPVTPVASITRLPFLVQMMNVERFSAKNVVVILGWIKNTSRIGYVPIVKFAPFAKRKVAPPKRELKQAELCILAQSV